MDLSQRFEKIQKACKDLDVPRSVRDHFVRSLEYFRLQSLCDFDRRDKPEVIHRNWLHLQQQMKGANFLPIFKNDKTFWLPIAAFVGDLDFVPDPPPKPRPPERPEHYNWDATDLLVRLLEDLPRTRFATREERDLVYLGLRTLHLESQRIRFNRDRKAIIHTWKTIHPIITRYKMLEPFKDNKVLQQRVRFFIQGTFD